MVVISGCLSGRKDQSKGLMHQIRYHRNVMHQQVERRTKARREFERLYAEDPSFEDVQERLDITS